MSQVELPKVLCVDDEPNVIAGLERNLRRDFPVATALGAQAALDVLKSDRDFAVIISDMRMPGMDGATFLAEARLLIPHSFRVLLTGQADLPAVIKAVNSGNIHHYLKKPTSKDDLVRIVHAGFATFRENVAHERTVQQALRAGLNLTFEAMRLIAPKAWSRAVRVQQVAVSLGEALEMRDELGLEVASTLLVLGEERDAAGRSALCDDFLGSSDTLSGAKAALAELWGDGAGLSALARVVRAARRIVDIEQKPASEAGTAVQLAQEIEPKILAAWGKLREHVS